MNSPETVQFFLEDGLRTSAQAGEHNFIRLVCEVLTDSGLTVEYCAMKDRHAAQGLALTHMKAPSGPCGLVFRRVYHYPFWQIEQTEKRWNWDVAKAGFDPDTVDETDATRFQKFWQKRLFPDCEATNEGFVYVPLQGRLLQHRSFQSCSPLDMVTAVLVATDQPVVVTLHPKETYAPKELSHLEAIIAKHPHARLELGGMDRFLPACQSVITQNSSAAFNGYLFDKPAILFGKIDFHHIAQAATPETLDDEMMRRPSSGFSAKYLWWFWQQQAINAGRPDAKDKIKARLARFNWPVV